MFWQWLICDGPGSGSISFSSIPSRVSADSIWVENLNSLLDESRVLCLANRERIGLTQNTSVIFEVDHLESVSPAMISRCGIVYVDSGNLPWLACFKSWTLSLFSSETEQSLPVLLQREIRRYIMDLGERYIQGGLDFLQSFNNPAQSLLPSNNSLVRSLFKLIAALCSPSFGIQFTAMAVDRYVLNRIFVFAYIWSLGASVEGHARADFDSHVRHIFLGLAETEITTASVFDVHIDHTSTLFKFAGDLISKPVFEPRMHFAGTLFPTVESIQYQHVIHLLAKQGMPTLLVGPSGVGKTSVSDAAIQLLLKNHEWLVSATNFNHSTTPLQFNHFIRAHLRTNSTGQEFRVNNSKNLLLFIDNLSAPNPDSFGSQVCVF
jgi:dynein heavy chain